jgi:hypothetical protein
MSDRFTRPDAAAQRGERTYQALTHLAERHAGSPDRRARATHPAMAAPHEVVRLVAALAAGSLVTEPDEPAVDDDDLVAALTLLPGVRAEWDSIERQLLKAARRQGMTWQDIAFSLGLNTPQAARQRFERLAARADDAGVSAS